MRNVVLHRLLETYTVDSSSRLVAAMAAGDELPYELAEDRGVGGSGAPVFYSYRPLTEAFIDSHREQLAQLRSHEPAVRALSECEALDVYLAARGEVRMPAGRRGLAQASLTAFLRAVFAGRTEFGFEPAHFETAYAELERAVYDVNGTATVIAPVQGVALDPSTTELALGDGVSLVRGDALADAPAAAVWSDSGEPNVLALIAVDPRRTEQAPVAVARSRFRRVLSALRLFERGGYSLGPVAWQRSQTGTWRTASIAIGGRPRRLTLVPAAQEEELRAFCRLVARRPRGGSELSWALARFEMGCERLGPLEAVTDYLLALRALLEPEGPSSGRLPQRLAAICAAPQDRARLAERTADAISLERAVMGGIAPRNDNHAVAVVEELSEHLRAVLRDALCGHLDADLCGLADDLIAEAAGSPTT
ncbi:MAG TPA: hypothetical protein VFW09_00825 [Solirubrobacteraceae bacterium]|nr:hypothetical protein [Solirubrobacteraceae bacterium]